MATPTAGSNAVRHIVASQAIRDLQHSPIFGIDYGISDQASQVYLQELASGGLLLFGGMTVYALGAMASAWTLRHRDATRPRAVCQHHGVAGAELLEADLTDRFYYVPPAILAALIVGHNRGLLGTEQTPQADETGQPEQPEPHAVEPHAVEPTR